MLPVDRGQKLPLKRPQAVVTGCCAVLAQNSELQRGQAGVRGLEIGATTQLPPWSRPRTTVGSIPKSKNEASAGNIPKTKITACSAVGAHSLVPGAQFPPKKQQSPASLYTQTQTQTPYCSTSRPCSLPRRVSSHPRRTTQPDRPSNPPPATPPVLSRGDRGVSRLFLQASKARRRPRESSGGELPQALE